MEQPQEHPPSPPEQPIITTDSLQTISQSQYLPPLIKNRRAVEQQKPRRAHTSFIERYDVEDVLREFKAEQQKNEKAKQFILRLRKQKQLHEGRHFLIKQQQDRKKREKMRQQTACLRSKIEEERAKKKLRAEYNLKIVRFRQNERMKSQGKSEAKSLIASKRELQSRTNSQRIEIDLRQMESSDHLSGLPLPKKLCVPNNQIYLSEEDRKVESIRKKIHELGKMLKRDGIEK